MFKQIHSSHKNQFIKNQNIIYLGNMTIYFQLLLIKTNEGKCIYYTHLVCNYKQYQLH